MADTRAFLQSFVATLHRNGVRDAVIAPGSRSTPLAVTLWESPITVWVQIDERSAGFFALGLAKSSRRPVALLCTSGTAAANFLPAIIEARLSRVPLIVMTADRPRALRDRGAAQTINQVHLYGIHAKWFQDLPEPRPSLARYSAETAARAIGVAVSAPAGPVHLNFPLAEPLLPEGPAATSVPPFEVPPSALAAAHIPKTAQQLLAQAQRGIVVAGPDTPDLPYASVLAWQDKGWPIFADPVSGLRRYPRVISAYDPFLRVRPHVPAPDLIVQIGAPMTSKALNQWMAECPAIVVDETQEYRQPFDHPTITLVGDVPQTFAELARWAAAAPDPWAKSWLDRDATTRVHVSQILATMPDQFEAKLYSRLSSLLPAASDGPLFIGNSMPIRDLDAFSGATPFAVFANRGANGIDGLVSTALGIAANRGQVLAILGDLAFYHVLNGLLLARRYQLTAFFVVINNNGGGIFSFLSQRVLPSEEFEALYGVPHGIDFSGLAPLYGATFARVSTASDVVLVAQRWQNQPGLKIIEWQTAQRSQNADWHQDLWSRLNQALPTGEFDD